MDAKCKTNGMGNNITANTNNNHITMHSISPKFTHMYICTYVQGPLNVRNLTVPLKTKVRQLVEMAACWILPHRTVRGNDRNSPLRRTFHNPVFCANLIFVYLHSWKEWKSETFDCWNCTWNVWECWGTNSAQRGGILMLWQHDRSFNLLQPERKLSPSKRSEPAFYILC